MDNENNVTNLKWIYDLIKVSATEAEGRESYINLKYRLLEDEVLEMSEDDPGYREKVRDFILAEMIFWKSRLFNLDSKILWDDREPTAEELLKGSNILRADTLKLAILDVDEKIQSAEENMRNAHFSSDKIMDMRMDIRNMKFAKLRMMDRLEKLMNGL